MFIDTIEEESSINYSSFDNSNGQNHDINFNFNREAPRNGSLALGNLPSAAISLNTDRIRDFFAEMNYDHIIK